jgi:putative endonuclease
MATLYILYSKKIDSYYLGSCNDFTKRLDEHLSKKNDNSFTCRADDWVLYFKIDQLEYEQARNIEKHIKKMKSRKYYENLSQYPELVLKLREKYSVAGSFR